MLWHCLLCLPLFCFPFVFPFVVLIYVFLLHACFFPPFIRISPFSQASLRALASAESLSNSSNGSSEGLCANDAIEIQQSDLFVTHAELKWWVSRGQTLSLWLYGNIKKKKKSTFARLSSGWLRTWCMCVSVCVHQWHTQAFPRCCISCYCSDKKEWTSKHRERLSPRMSRWNCDSASGMSDTWSVFFVFFLSVIWATNFLSLFPLRRSNKLRSTIFDLNPIHMEAIFFWCHAHGGRLEWWDEVVLLWCRLQVT